MRLRPLFWLLLSVTCFIGAVYFWRLGDEWQGRKAGRNQAASPTSARVNAPQSRVSPLSTSPMALLPLRDSTTATPATNGSSRFQYRLSNTPKTPSQLARQEHAILLANALIDSTQPLNLAIPASLRAQGEPGAYIVQARGLVDDRFRAEVKGAGASIVAYIPNNAYLVSASADVAAALNAVPGVQTVLPFEPYYKLERRLLALAVEQEPLPAGSRLNVVVFADGREKTLAALEQLGLPVTREARSPFGPILTVTPRADSLTTLAGLPGVQAIEIASERTPANDLSRAKIGVAVSSVAPTNYQGLSGVNVLVNVNDSGIDSTHPDLAGRVFGPAVDNDTSGHGTHVAGTIAGNGSQSLTVSNASGSVMPPVGGQFRGMATNATLFSMDYRGPSDFELQETAARTNALISNNSWTYASSDYDIAAASFDAAVRDSLPDTTGSQPLVYVFAAGNNGNGRDDGVGVSEGTILSPATAKNVITVGAIEQLRNITNAIEIVQNGNTNTSQPWLGMTDSDSEVAGFSSRGNVGVNLEGDFGRFKPDVVAPGTFVVSTRSQQFDPGAYYNPTYVHDLSFLDLVETNSIDARRIRIPFNAIRLDINATAIYPVVDLPIYLNKSTLAPILTDAPVGTNTYSTTDMTPRDALWTIGIGNLTNVAVQYRLDTSVWTTNDFGNFFEVLSNLNSELGPFYRYESGTSMAAANVSGVLALMEDYFTNKMGLRPSPALMKAMLINGARTANAQYDLEVRKPLNDQGWGLINLTNSLPIGLASQVSQGAMLFFDQNPSNAVATGDRRTFNIKVDPTAVNRPLRVTLVWTDPPGNPAAGVKLVNDLDLIVTNLDQPTVYYVGNDIPVGSSFTFPSDTNAAPNFDFVNNVENVYLSEPLATNYSITVVGHRVNVNAVTAHPNNVAQDYALVVSSGNGETNTALTITASNPAVNNNQINSTIVTNDFASLSNEISGQLLLNQHVGANSPLVGEVTTAVGSNTIWGVGGTNGVVTLGETNQWHFYIMTNTTTFSNAAFATFLSPNLATPRMGVTNYDQPDEATRVEADIDMYVSKDPGLLKLDPAVIAAADKSVGRGGTEVVAYSNSVAGDVYYIGIQSQDQQAAEYAFFGVFSRLPFSSTDDNGVETVRGINVPAPIPEGTPKNPGGVMVIGLALQPIEIRRVVITNTLTHDDIGNLFGAISHNQQSTVLNNHTCVKVPSTIDCYTNYTYIYEDNGEGDIPDSQHTDGPGDLRGFVGERGEGVWLLTEVDNVGGSTGQVDSVFIRLDPAFLDDGTIILNIQPNSFAFTSVLVPPEATNLTICVENQSSTPLPVQLYVRRGDFPTLTDYDFKLDIPLADCLTISSNSFPPLQAGRYYIGVFNPNSISQTVKITVTMGLGLTGVPPIRYTSTAPVPILDDAVSYSSLFVTNDARIVRAEVGVAIEHPRVSDLALTLISPSGKRILLYENRGGSSASGLGSATTTTNYFGTETAGGALAQTNILDPVPTSGILVIDHDFFTLPDTLDVYYEGVNIFSSGPVSGSTPFPEIPYGPGNATTLTIVLNQAGDTNSTTQWTYTPRVISQQAAYFTFTENTNLAQLPVKFALNSPTALSTTTISDFQSSAPGAYTSGQSVGPWTVTGTNDVSVVSDPTTATAGQFLALANGTISNNVPLAPGSKYSLNYAYRGPGIVSWWRGEIATNAIDELGQNNGVLAGGVTFQPGEVNQAFTMDGTTSSITVPASPSLNVKSFTIEGWINPTSTASRAPIAEYANASGPVGVHFWINEGSPGTILINVRTAGTFLNKGIVTAPGIVLPNQWSHVAATFDQPSGVVTVYCNGVNVGTANLGIITPETSFPFIIGYRPIGVSEVGAGARFPGKIDELSLYKRALSPSEIKAIYALGAAGKFTRDPSVSVPQNLSEAQVVLGGIRTDKINGSNTNWLTRAVTFTATAPSVPLVVTGLEPGMLLDSFTLDQLPSDQFVFPEEPLKALVGDNAYGLWKLELWDSRVGATNPAPQLVSWQLRFILETNGPAVTPLFDGVAVTNTVPPCAIAYYSVQVPDYVRYVTNRLLFATPPGVNVWFNQTNLPAPGGTNAGDFPLIPGPTTSGSFTLFTNSINTNSSFSTPPLVPGSRYYLAVENPCGSGTNVTFAIQVDFAIDAITLTNMIPYSNTNSGATNTSSQLYVYEVSTNAARVQFEINGPTGDMTLVARRGLPPPSQVSYDYNSVNPTTNDELIVVLTNSVPIALAPGRWYLDAINVSGTGVSYSIMASEWPETGRPFSITNAVLGTNSFCLTWTSLPLVHYYIEGKQALSDPGWYKATYTLTAAANAMDWCIELPSPFQFFRVTEGLSLVDVPEPQPVVSASVVTNGVALNWIDSITGRYEVQWSPTLLPGAWTSFTNTISSTNGWFSFVDDGTQTSGFTGNRFYRVRQLLPP